MARISGNKRHTPVNPTVCPILTTKDIVPMPGADTAVPTVTVAHEVGSGGYNDMFVTVYIDLTRKKIAQMDGECSAVRKEVGRAEQAIKQAVDDFVYHENRKTAPLLCLALEEHGPCYEASVEDSGKLIEHSDNPIKIVISRTIKWYSSEEHSTYGAKESAGAADRTIVLTKRAAKGGEALKTLMDGVLKAIETRDAGRDKLRRLQRKIDRAEGEIASPAELRARANGTQYAKALAGTEDGKSFLDKSMEEIGKQIEELYAD